MTSCNESQVYITSEFYNKLDTQPFLEAVINQRSFFYDLKLDMFKDGLSLPCLSEKIMIGFELKDFNEVFIHQKTPYRSGNFLPLQVDERLKGYISQDKDSQRYDEKEFIGKNEVLKLQKEQNNKCHYCWRGFNKDTKWTLDRINNSIGHNTGNYVLCCENCNKRRSDQHYKTFYRKEALRRYSYKHPMVYLIDEENRDVFYKLKNSICGGPSIVFHRYAEADKTKIKRPIYKNGKWLEGKEGKMVRKIVGYDCNVLYLNCIGQNIPCGVLKWSVYTGNQSKEDIDMFIRNFNRISCGFIEVDIHTLEELMNKFGEFPLIFKNMEYDANEVIGEDMRKIYNNYDEMSDKDKLSYDGSKKLMTRKLISSFKDEKVLIKSDRLCWLLDQGLVVSKIHGFIRGEKGRIFEKFVEKVSNERRKGDVNPNYAIIADMWKLVGNSAFGRTGMNKNKFHKIQYGNEKLYNKKVGSCLFKDANQYGNVFEISSDFHRTKQNIPIQIACSIYDDAKLKMSQFYYDCVDKYLDLSDYQYIQMDTDSAYISLTGHFEDLIKPGMKEEYLKDENNWFLRKDTDENKAFDRRKAGLFKPEFVGAGIVALGSKTYFVKGFGDKHKYSCKGIQKKNNCSEICFNNYLQVLLNQRKSKIVNKGIRILNKKQIEGSGSCILNENRQVYMYSVEKVGLTAKNDKRCVMNDKISTVPLDI